MLLGCRGPPHSTLFPYTTLFRSPVCSTTSVTASLYPPRSIKRTGVKRSEEHTSELQSQSKLVCRLQEETKPQPVVFQPHPVLTQSGQERYWVGCFVCGPCTTLDP